MFLCIISGILQHIYIILIINKHDHSKENALNTILTNLRPLHNQNHKIAYIIISSQIYTTTHISSNLNTSVVSILGKSLKCHYLYIESSPQWYKNAHILLVNDYKNSPAL